ncbi:MAG TPA: MBL fold metallo-hydrolase [Candidatus Brocadiia bacterium]|nr:MBL fold metallo-hydrolase [Candidatus Brocadiia bacterium]
MNNDANDSTHPGIARLTDSTGRSVLQTVLFLADRPGQLSEVAGAFAELEGNITAFDYDRSQDAHQVLIEVCFPSVVARESALEAVSPRLVRRQEQDREDEVSVTDPASVLDLRIELPHRPGELAALARLFTRHGANVVVMHYHHLAAPEETRIAVAAPSQKEVSLLLGELNERGYRYKVLYRGDESEEMGQVIGLKLTERFYLRMRKLIGEEDVQLLKQLVHSSADVTRQLEGFAREAGRELRAGEVYIRLIALAASSRRRSGPNFTHKVLLDQNRAGARLIGIALPTGANVYALQRGGETALLESGYGLYYQDLIRTLSSLSVPPESIGTIYMTHPDADHAGTAWRFERELGTRIVAHPTARDVYREQHRGLGSAGRNAELLRLYTKLIDSFTDSQPPRSIESLPDKSGAMSGPFPLRGEIEICGIRFTIIESLGGHVPGQVFYLSREAGLLVTGDYLINVADMTQEEKDLLSIPRFLMLSTNSDSAIFRKEMDALTKIAIEVDAELRATGRNGLTILPGHGEPYQAATLSGR